VQQTFQCVCLHTRTHISQLSPVFLTHSNTCAQHINTRYCLTSRFVCLQAGLQSSCIRKVLRPANSIKIFLGSSQSYSKFSVGTQNPHCSPLQNTALPPLSALCPNTKPAPAAHPNTPLPSIVPSALTNALPCYQPTFTRRTSGHCLWAVRVTNPSDSSLPSFLPSYSIKCSACHCTPVFTLSLSLSVSV